MAKLNLPYVQRIVDRHGHIRHYYRRNGYSRITLPGDVGSAAFMRAYQEAGNGAKVEGAGQSKPGSVSALIAAYYRSAEWRALSVATQGNYRNILERFRDDYGDLSARDLGPQQIKLIRDKGADKPGATRNLMKRLRGLYAFALDRDLVAINPVVGVKLPREGKGFRPWTEADIAQFVKHWPEGSRARLALALLLYTGQRRSDVVTMGRQHVRDGLLHVTQKKGGGKVMLALPLHPELKRTLDALPKDNLTFIMTAYRRPMTEAGFTKWFGECVVKAGLPSDLSPHGLRKAAARRLAEAGASPHQIAAITGHASLKEVERYTLSASQPILAKAAMKLIRDRK
jgi:integrase